MDEVVKLTPPKIVKDEEVQVKNPPPPPPKIIIEMADEFYTRNPSVAELSRQGNIITLKMKDGTKEKYDMSKKERIKALLKSMVLHQFHRQPPP
jgi:hypothetical protein